MLNEWIRRRLEHLLAAPVGLELHGLVCERLCFAFHALLSFLAMGLVRAIGNAWPTTRRMLQRATSCLLGCMAVGGRRHPSPPPLS